MVDVGCPAFTVDYLLLLLCIYDQKPHRNCIASLIEQNNMALHGVPKGLELVVEALPNPITISACCIYCSRLLFP